MRFKYCPECGSRLSARNLGDEKDVPWCERCGRPWFDMFSVAIIALVHDCAGRVLLLRQNYISTEFCNLVSGYVKPGESAEECMVREIKEETGLDVIDSKLLLTSWFEKKGMLMIGFVAEVRDSKFTLSSEVDSAAWYNPTEILQHLSNRPGSTSRLLAERYLSEYHNTSNDITI